MNKHFRKVLEVLKTRKEVKALGFSRKEIKAIAAKIADKLKLEDDATDEEVKEAIDDEVDSVLPILQLSQSMVDRRINDYQNSLHDDDEPDDDEPDDDEPDDDEPKPRKNGKKNAKKDKNSDDLKQLIKSFTDEISGLKKEISSIKEDKAHDNRSERLRSLVKDTGDFGKCYIRQMSRMTFKDDDDFEDFLDEVKEDIEKENQERANKGLEKLGTPPGSQTGKNKKDETPSDEVLSDDEIRSIASL